MKIKPETSVTVTVELYNGEIRQLVISKGSVLAGPIIEVFDETTIPEGEETLWLQS